MTRPVITPPFIAAIFLAAMFTVMSQSCLAAASGADVRSVRGSFDDVRERVQLAIEGRGLVVSYVARVGEMLARTGGDVGTSARIFTNAEVLEFCSARYSADAMAADPHSIVQCPYGIAVYVLTKEPDRVFVAYRRNVVDGRAATPALAAVDRLLAEIVDEALK